MFNWLGQRFEKKKQKTRQLREREFNHDLAAQDSARQQASSDSLCSLLKRAIADAEQIVASIKMRAQTEAEAEATRIIAQAKLEVQEIKDRAEIAVQQQAEDILSAANRRAEITEIEAKQKALQYLIKASEALLSTSEATVPPLETSSLAEAEIELDIASKEKVEEPAQLQEEAPEEVIEQPVQLQQEASEEKTAQPTQLRDEVTVSEPVETTTEEHPPEERPGRKETDSARLKQDSQTLYAGEVELAIAIPVELKMVSRLYNHLQTIPELKILQTRGSWERGTTITVVLDKPIPLISLISKIPGVEVTPELPQKDSSVKGTPSSLLRAGGKGVKRIKLALKEAQPL